MTGSRTGDYKQAYDNLNIPKSLRKTLDADYTWEGIRKVMKIFWITV